MEKLKKLLETEKIVVAPGCFDPLSALAIENIGFKAAYLGGWAVGAHLGTTEPLTTLTEFADISRNISHVSDIPLTVDAGAGFGDLPMVKRMLKCFEEAGCQGIQLEDQVYPKPISYHKGKHYIISADEMLQKIDICLKYRKTPDTIIIARTDAGRNANEDWNNAIERANLYAKTGCDLVMTFPRNEEEMILTPKKVDYPLCYVASEGLGRPIPSPEEAASYGYKMIIYPLTPVISAFSSIKRTYENMFRTGRSGFTPEETSALSKEIMSLIHIDELSELDSVIK